MTTTHNDEDDPLVGKLPPIVERLEKGEKTPVCIIVVGMAGSGKTTLLTQLQRSLQSPQVTSAPTEPGNASGDDGAAAAVAVAASAADTGGSSADNDENDENEDDNEIDNENDIEIDRQYCINLDPATIHLPYFANIDIRDTVNYHQVMQQHRLGPNGAIMTSLNLFVTKFDQVLGLLERRAYGGSSNDDNGGGGDGTTDGDDGTQGDSSAPDSAPPTPPSSSSSLEYILVDTPGQIEAFTWSASGSIVSEALASAFPTVLCFVVDTVRCASSPNAFMSNMLYACSMMYRTRLPLVVCFNKTDVVSHHTCLEWMRDHESFQSALDDAADSSGFYGSLTRSLSLVLDEFYSNFANACGVSAVTGAGIEDFWNTVDKARQDFCDDYIDDLKNRVEEQQARQRAIARNNVSRLQRDLEGN